MSENKELTQDEMENVNGGTTYIVYDEEGNEIRRVLSKAMAETIAAGNRGTYKKIN